MLDLLGAVLDLVRKSSCTLYHEQNSLGTVHMRWASKVRMLGWLARHSGTISSLPLYGKFCLRHLGPAVIAFAKFVRITFTFPEFSGGFLYLAIFEFSFSSSNLSSRLQLAPPALGQPDWTKEKYEITFFIQLRRFVSKLRLLGWTVPMKVLIVKFHFGFLSL